MLLEVIDLVLTCECHVARGGNYLNFRSEDLECKVEAHLIIAGACRSVCHGVGADFLGVIYNRKCLEYAFGADADRICAVAEHVTGYHEAYAAVVIVVSDVEGGMRCRAETVCLVGDYSELFFAETSGIGYGCMYFISEVFGQIFYCKRCVQSSAEREQYLFFVLHFSLCFDVD